MVAQHASNARQSLEVIRTRAFGREQQEHQIHRLIVESFEIDRLVKSREDANDRLDACKRTVRYRDAVTDAGRAKALALQDNIENFPLRKPGDFRRLAANSWRSCFLEFTLRAGMIAFCCSKSANAILFSFCAKRGRAAASLPPFA